MWATSELYWYQPDWSVTHAWWTRCWVNPRKQPYHHLQVGAIIGKGGAIVKQIREETSSKIRVCEGVPTSEDRVIVIAARDDDPEIEENNAQVRAFSSPCLSDQYIGIQWHSRPFVGCSYFVRHLALKPLAVNKVTQAGKGKLIQRWFDNLRLTQSREFRTETFWLQITHNSSPHCFCFTVKK